MSQSHQPDPRVTLVLELIKAQPYRSWTIADLATRVHVSTGHLRRLFLLGVGRSPMHYVRDARLRQAAHLLLSSHRRVKDIMREVGISDSSHFTRDFKAKFGASPTKYRRLLTDPSARSKSPMNDRRRLLREPRQTR